MRTIETKTAFISIVGKPNVGKSTLLNALVNKKVSIVSYRPQTTRNRITGILTDHLMQYVFIDTPGLLKAKSQLDHAMRKTVQNSVGDTDAAILVVDPSTKVAKAEYDLIRQFQQTKLAVVLAINKIDQLSDKTKIISCIAEYQTLYPFAAVVPISAKTRDNIPTLLKELSKFAQPSVHFFPDDMATDQSDKMMMSEILREKLLLNLYDEIPHGVVVVTERMKETKQMLHFSCMIYCERNNHKGIIIGKNGATLKKIATQARIAAEDFFGCKVHLQCWVKVKEGWKNQQTLLRSLGLSGDG